MHFLLSTAIVAGLLSCGFSQDPSTYSDCDKEQTILDGCVSKHLGSLEQRFQQGLSGAASLENPMALMGMGLSNICNSTDTLEMYYTCVYGGLTTCLKEKNSSQVDKVPNTEEISMGIVDFCMAEPTMNATCMEPKKMDVLTCITHNFKAVADGPPVCGQYEVLYKCVGSSLTCAGGADVQKFVSSARPNICDNLSSASQAVATVSMLLLSMLLGLAISL